MIDIIRLLVDIIAFYAIYLLLSISLNVEYGYAGIPNFGKALFFAAGGFVVGSLTSRLLAPLAGIDLHQVNFKIYNVLIATKVSQYLSGNILLALTAFIAMIILGAIMGGLLGVVASYPAIRLREDYLAITLLAAGELARIIARNYDPLICGTLGVSVPDPFAWLPGIQRSIIQAGIMMSIAVMVWLLVERIARSPFGRLLRAIREDERAAEVYGKNVASIRMRALLIGSSIAGLAGAIYAFYVGSVHADDYTPIRTFIVWVMVVLGGAGNNAGAALGSLVYVLSDRIIMQVKYYITVPFDINYLSYMAFGTLLILVLMYRPKGILPEKPSLTIDFSKVISRLREEAEASPEGSGG